MFLVQYDLLAIKNLLDIFSILLTAQHDHQSDSEYDNNSDSNLLTEEG